MDYRQFNMYSMRSLAEAEYTADAKLMEGDDDYKFPTEMTFEDVSDASILQGSTDLVGEMFKFIIQNNDYVVPYIPHLKPKFLAWGAKGVLSEFDQSEFSVAKNIEKSGLVYVPNTCKKDRSKCHLHIALHGNGQSLQELKSKNKNFNIEDYAFAT